ncbi:hypothetical protein C8Q75DRAFT_745325 [Abortiporus biennis]|nr:hypothetical protein C8Q75DRAFT_745325 [Abortiporus biennis]
MLILPMMTRILSTNRRGRVFPSSSLERIPTEIILKILEGISNNVDLISFSLTNTILYFFGYDILQKRYLENGKADWEGDRLICVGDYADFRDLPPNLYTEDELKNICSDFKLKLTKPQQRPIDIICERWQSPYDLASEKWKSVRKHYGLTSQKKVIFEHLKITKQPHMCTNALALLRTAFKDFPYTDENPPVLCNISKRVYVNIKDYYNTKSGISWMDILASNICWSSDPSSAMRYDVTRGKWAGDRFALRPLSQLHELGGEGDWKNITEGELKRIRRIARECQV